MTMKERIQAKIAPQVMKLPDRVLRKLAGDPVVVDGRTLDVRIQLAAAQSSDGPSIADLEPTAARAVAAESFALTNAKRAAGVATHDLVVGAGNQVPVRIYRPAVTDGLRPGVMFMHQGGFVIGDLDTCDSFCSRVAAELGAVVISVDYRMGPEHRFPAAAVDADTVWAWSNDSTDSLGIDPTKLVVAGDSAGAQMTAAMCQRLRATGAAQPAVQVLVYPYVDATASEGSMVSCADAFPLTAATMDWFQSHSLPDGFDPGDPSMSPALTDQLGDVAPAIVVTAGFDPLRDQGMAFAVALRDAGVEVTDRCEDSLCHSFLALDGLVPEAAAATDHIIADIARHLRP
jgi:acetyl esterase/lipase